MTGTSDLAGIYVLLAVALWTVFAYVMVKVIARITYGPLIERRRRPQPRSRPARPFDWEWDD